LRPTLKPMVLAAIGMAPLVALGWFLAVPLARLVVPKYVAAAPAMRWALLPPLVGCFMPIHNVYNVVRRQGLYAVAIACGMAAGVDEYQIKLNKEELMESIRKAVGRKQSPVTA